MKNLFTKQRTTLPLLLPRIECPTHLSAPHARNVELKSLGFSVHPLRSNRRSAFLCSRCNIGLGWTDEHRRLSLARVGVCSRFDGVPEGIDQTSEHKSCEDRICQLDPRAHQPACAREIAVPSSASV